MTKFFHNCTLVLPDQLLANGALLVDAGKISWLGLEPDAPKVTNAEKIDCSGHYLAPGFIDVHAHGGGGGSFMNPVAEDYAKGFRMHLEHGVTSLTPTPIVHSADEMKQHVAAVRGMAGRENLPHFLGFFLEGPYMADDPAKGKELATESEFAKADPALYQAIVTAAEGTIVRWMAAPELPGVLEFGRAIRKLGIIPCIGHSQATFTEVKAAKLAGFSSVIHLYSVMSTVTRQGGFRRGGVVEAALLLDDLDVEIIADGCHLPPELISLAVKCIGYDRLMLVSDATSLAGYPDGEYEMEIFGKTMKIILEDGVSKSPDRKFFAGSIASGDRLVRTVCQQAGQPLWAAVRMLTRNPAHHLGLSGRKGELVIGADADLVLLDDAIRTQAVFLSGRQVI